MHLRELLQWYLVTATSIALAIALAASPARSQDGYAVRGISFKGNKTIPTSILKLVIGTKAPGTFGRLLGHTGSEYDQEAIAADLDKLRLIYQREGFLHAVVGPVQTEMDSKARKIRVVIPIAEGEPVKIHEVTYQLDSTGGAAAAHLTKALKNLQRDMYLKTGERFRDSSVMLDQIALAREFADQGFAYCRINPVLTVDDSASSVRVEWRIASGPRCYYGPIRILGQSKITPHVITRQLAFAQGSGYRQSLTERSQQQIYGLGVFQVATVTPVLGTPKDTTIPIEVFVKDAKRFTSKLGVGYGSEDHFRIFSDSRFLGFLGGARRLQLYFKHSDLEPYHLSATVVQPGVPTPRTTLSLSPFLRRQKEPGFTVNRYGGALGAAHQFSATLNGSATYSLERVKVDQSAQSTLAVDSNASTLYNKSQIILGATFDNSGPMFNPRHGFFNSGSIAISGLGFGSNTKYTKILFDLRRYQPLGGLVLATRVKFGSIKTIGSESFIPVEERFYSGGGSSVRGWGRSELGPKENGLPIGGLSLLEGSAEIRFPIGGILAGALFADAGNVWLQSYDFPPGDLRYAAGAGIRITTPIGPIRLDVARPVADLDKAIQVHISVGQAF
jgi:outer membrane protein assembly complex protein YaeT